MTPERIQRKRTKGWRMPVGTVYVGRPTKWGNPFFVERLGTMPTTWYVGEYYAADFRNTRVFGGYGTRQEASQRAVALYALHTGPLGMHELDMDEVRRELAGRDLACWCPLDQPCHADVLLELANREPADDR